MSHEERKELVVEGNADEMQYLNLVQHILENGTRRENRTGIDTLSIFGTQMRFNLRHHTLPLLTTKKLFWRGILEELLWFISGSTNAKQLHDRNIKFWDGNCKDFMERSGLTNYPPGELGPIYGFQWRHFGATYKTCMDDYSGQGVDQLKNVIETLKTNPNDRRIIMSAWNPVDIPKMALPPCHCFVQFYVNNGELSCQMYQRSADMGLGVPFNIASYATLTHLLAHITNLKPGDFVHTIGDAHIYVNHVDALRSQLKRTPVPFPKLTVSHSVTNIDNLRSNDFQLWEYNALPNIYMEMAV